METLATLNDLKARIDWDLSEEEERIANGALEDLSEDARYYSGQDWRYDTAPPYVRSLVLRAAARFLRNPEGFSQSRAGDETVMWGDRSRESDTAEFTPNEIDRLQAITKPHALSIVSTYAWSNRSVRDDLYVPAPDKPQAWVHGSERDWYERVM